MSNGKTGASYAESKPQEDRLLETVASSGGVRLQPTRDAIQVFLREAAKLDAMALCHAIERKLQSPMWQACLFFFFFYRQILIVSLLVFCWKACVLLTFL